MMRELYEWVKNIYVTPSAEVIALPGYAGDNNGERK